MKKILGLDLGTTSIGWAFIHEAENQNETSSIIKLGVRVNPLSTEEQQDFEKGKSISVNADRTLKRGARRNLQRYKQRRDNLIALLKKEGFITDKTILSEAVNNATHSTYALRSRAATDKIEKEELARVLLSINKKRGYKSSRKTNDEDEGQAIDGMSIAKKIYNEKLTPGQYSYQRLKKKHKSLPEYYPSDLQTEFDLIWNHQKKYYPIQLSDNLKQNLLNKNKTQSWAICKEPFDLVGIKQTGKPAEKKLEKYLWRTQGLSQQLELEALAIVLQEINNDINSSSGYLGAISDRSKELYFNEETVGQYLYRQLKANPHFKTKNQVFYRQDYLGEFNQIWETQRSFHPEMTDTLRKEIRDIIIFYQRRLKSQKGLISFCEFECQVKEVNHGGQTKSKTIGSRVIPKSSPLFQEFKIWQDLSNVRIISKETKEEFVFDQETKQMLFDHLNIKGNLKKTEILKLLNIKPTQWEINYTELQGNRTNQVLFAAYQKIMELEGHEVDFKKLSPTEIIDALGSLFESWGISKEILVFDAELDHSDFEQQASYQLWHLLYSYEGDDSNSGNERLYRLLQDKFGFKLEYARIIANVLFQDDYGSLSQKAIRKIYPFIKEQQYSDACKAAGYNHSSSLTKEENEKRVLKDKLGILAKNSLRNPIVEKILNQLVNVINQILDDPKLGKPDEIRIELARELKKNAKQRAEMTLNINRSKGLHDEYRAVLNKEFGIKNPTRNDIIRYKLYLELGKNGYKTLYTDTYIQKEKLFSKEFDIEHIIPKSRLFDDSFSNKTLAVRQVNLEKGSETAIDFMTSHYDEATVEQYTKRIEFLYKEDIINKAKYKKLLMTSKDIGEGFIERDLRDSQYIAKKARTMLMDICKSVVPTTGTVTDRLREDWDLINVMKELNLEKYRTLGMTETITNRHNESKEQIIDWTKRNDHRHHAMDALTVAFTTHNHIQYLNNLNAARDNKNSKLFAIRNKITHLVDQKNGRKKRRFVKPMQHFRTEAKTHLESILISFKNKNKVVTRNKNKIAGKTKAQLTLTPRGQMHKETVYGRIQVPVTKSLKIGTKCTKEAIEQVTHPSYKAALLLRLAENSNDPKKAFAGKNAPAKNPVLCSDGTEVPEMVKTLIWEQQYTIRKEVDPTLKLDKVIDQGVKQILQARLDEYGGKAQDAFSNLDKNPIWQDQQNGACIKRVTIRGVNNAEALHSKKDHNGQDIIDEEGNRIPVDFVSTGNNHHVAIYEDQKGNLQEEVVSFYEAVARVNSGIPIINREHLEGWKFLFTMKQNEMFIFPNSDFNPADIDLLDPQNNTLISPHLFRVQKFTNKDYFFRHHLETNVEMTKSLNGTTWIRSGLSGVIGIIKVRINHLGQIVKIGE
ncbi:MAG: type II CRISPR RNA-guided endonuclease Cas9 [Reichenbachiella sp.]|uniref:type II CRISPR RNA-guided endonuclease Cas9 n=1 Tax=Reichenbachiella sp. TaxID=2184521 RepID=UPI0032982BE4